MKITSELLHKHHACEEQVELFEELYPDGLWPDVETLTEAAAAGLNVWWACRLLPAEGSGSFVAYGLWCAQQVAHLTPSVEAATCLQLVEEAVRTPGGRTSEKLHAAAVAAFSAYAGPGGIAGANYSAAYAAVGAFNARVNGFIDVSYAASSAADAAYTDAYATFGRANSARTAARQAQLACLAQLLEECHQ